MSAVFTVIDEKLNERREQAAVARAGGRAITEALTNFFEDVDSGRLGSHLADIITSPASPRHEVPGVGSPESIAHVWARCIDPAAGGWEWLARKRAHVGELTGYGPEDPSTTAVMLSTAEAMLNWPIVQAAFTAAVTIVRNPDAANEITTDGNVMVVDIDLGSAFDTEPRNLDERVTSTEMAESWREQAERLPKGQARSRALEMADEYDYSAIDDVREAVEENRQAAARFAKEHA